MTPADVLEVENEHEHEHVSRRSYLHTRVGWHLQVMSCHLLVRSTS